MDTRQYSQARQGSLSEPAHAALWTRSSELIMNLPQDLNVHIFKSGFETAADLLMGQVRVLVIQLMLLDQTHVHLIDLARSRGVEVLGVLPLPRNLAEDTLAGVRLIKAQQLNEALRRQLLDLRSPEPEKSKSDHPAAADVFMPEDHKLRIEAELEQAVRDGRAQVASPTVSPDIGQVLSPEEIIALLKRP